MGWRNSERISKAKEELAKLLGGTEDSRNEVVEAFERLIEAKLDDHVSDYYHNRTPEY